MYGVTECVEPLSRMGLLSLSLSFELYSILYISGEVAGFVLFHHDRGYSRPYGTYTSSPGLMFFRVSIDTQRIPDDL